ncbi:MAG: molecular chaperone HtpG, partial [Steroidobacteraceae bacterium]
VDAERKESKALLKRFKDALGARVLEVRVSERLRDSPACLVRGEGELSAQMRRVLTAAGQTVPSAQPLLELNVTHPLVRYLDTLRDQGAFGQLALLLYDQASLVEDGQLPNPADFSRRLSDLLVRLVQGAASAPPSADAAS